MVTNQKLRQAKIAKWTSLFNDQAASGLKVTDWCKENNLSIHAYYYWKRIIKGPYFYKTKLAAVLSFLCEAIIPSPSARREYIPASLPP